MEKNMILVGAGIAGLSTGTYGRMNGYKTSIFEMHNIPGGLCTAWKRKGYTFDISMHMLTGSKGGPADHPVDMKKRKKEVCNLGLSEPGHSIEPGALLNQGSCNSPIQGDGP